MSVQKPCHPGVRRGDRSVRHHAKGDQHGDRDPKPESQTPNEKSILQVVLMICRMAIPV